MSYVRVSLSHGHPAGDDGPCVRLESYINGEEKTYSTFPTARRLSLRSIISSTASLDARHGSRRPAPLNYGGGLFPVVLDTPYFGGRSARCGLVP